MSLITFLFLGLAWGCVPCDRRRLKYKWADPAVSFAGPFANLLLLVLGILFLALAGGLMPENEYKNPLMAFLMTLGYYNFVLFCLNMLPIPGFDGWNILRFFFPRIGEIRSEFAKGILVFLIFAGIFCLPYVYKLGINLVAYGAGSLHSIFFGGV